MLPLIITPNEILRAVAKPAILPPTEEEIKLAQGLIEAMKHYHGIGLAAPQVNVSTRLIVVATAGEPTVYFNPEISKNSWRKIEMEEGCLSIPGVFGLVKRPARVLAKYFNLSSQKKEEWLDGMVARIYQHEVDHLNGILFTDKATKLISGQELLAQYGLG
ncbi:MAG TPA: peptide deformylase [Candidatus Veblenbacteria bacterium]|uniref:Peptide deformylase n=3 Tax=Candidatus Vebleniibacteriota TaxID=1817921 RepID=A0A1G2Q6J3_9BACT|nr:MAG: Peptide deformylase [Parcubacteria group bacterium GW2011_GWA2_42_80]OHA55511.1 MAG: peptide deformylase [Candidatus Veblenbacteria bacterium RIFOXYA2_FULL_43_9]OHA55810.1 MAG: peptide deformylase [Candidatus Veblenbacteria bacterium RIFOXYB1_FULL_43_13]OHA57043.1 MAG: peptide deformylase [Candidatus Veblenbacteria bacterium RIFOXYC2_FULL_42_11]HCX38887.1 peptide deformylase [Candidatus Veblenbacteria bacterium]